MAVEVEKDELMQANLPAVMDAADSFFPDLTAQMAGHRAAASVGGLSPLRVARMRGDERVLALLENRVVATCTRGAVTDTDPHHGGL